MAHYVTYYENQIGGSANGVRNVFIGSRWQRGSGFGSFFAGLARTILPIFGQGLRAVGREALRGGINVLDDIGNNVAFKDSLKNRFNESRDILKEKAQKKINDMLMSGSGYKSLALNNALQSLNRRSTNRIAAALTNSKRRRRRTKKKKLKSRKTSSRKKTTGKKRRKRTGAIKKRKTKRSRGRKRNLQDIFD